MTTKRKYAVVELELDVPYYDGGRERQSAPVGPFDSREEANQWASEAVTRAGGGSWSVGPMTNPYPNRGTVADVSMPGDHEELTLQGKYLRDVAAKGNGAVEPWSYVPCALTHGLPNRLCIRPEGHG